MSEAKKKRKLQQKKSYSALQSYEKRSVPLDLRKFGRIISEGLVFLEQEGILREADEVEYVLRVCVPRAKALEILKEDFDLQRRRMELKKKVIDGLRAETDPGRRLQAIQATDRFV